MVSQLRPYPHMVRAFLIGLMLVRHDCSCQRRWRAMSALRRTAAFLCCIRNSGFSGRVVSMVGCVTASGKSKAMGQVPRYCDFS